MGAEKVPQRAARLCAVFVFTRTPCECERDRETELDRDGSRLFYWRRSLKG